MSVPQASIDVSAALHGPGYGLLPGVLDAGALAHLRHAFDRVWEAQPAGTGKVSQHVLLREAEFRQLLGNPSVRTTLQALFGDQGQLLAYDLLRQGPGSTQVERTWHRDFAFPGDHLVAANIILYLDDITPESGPTYVMPGTQRGRDQPPSETQHEPMPGEVAITARAGDAALINAAIWHSGGRNRGQGLRRAIYIYVGWWWLKRYDEDRGPLPWQAIAGADAEMLTLLGLKMPNGDLHMA